MTIEASIDMLTKREKVLAEAIKTQDFQIKELSKLHSAEQVRCWRIRRFKLNVELKIVKKELKALR